MPRELLRKHIRYIFPSTGLRELHREALNKCFSLSCVTHFIGLLADVVLAEAEKWPSQRRYGESYRWDSREFPRNIPQVSYPSELRVTWMTLKSRARERCSFAFRSRGGNQDIARILFLVGNGKSSPINGVHIFRVCERTKFCLKKRDVYAKFQIFNYKIRIIK